MATFITTIRVNGKGASGNSRDRQAGGGIQGGCQEDGRQGHRHLLDTGAGLMGVIIFDAPDDETATAAMLSLSAQGNVTTTTARAFGAVKIEKVVGMVGQ